MKKKSLIALALLATVLAYSQVGINIIHPRGALDINTNDTTNTMGLVLPSNSDVNSLINPQGGNVVAGTIAYDSTQDCVKFYKKTGQWSNCIKFSTSTIMKMLSHSTPQKNTTISATK